MHTLGTAAKATGLNKSTVLRAIRSGKISAVKDEHGEWQIDPAELHRVYPPVADAPRRTSAMQRHATLGAAEAASMLEAQIVSLKDVAALMREQLDDVRKDRDAWRSQAEGNQRLLSCSTSGQGVALFPQSRLIVGRSGSVRPLPKTEDRAAPKLQRHRRPNAAKAWGTPLGCVRYFMDGP